jgi:hypothetical protein
MNLPTLAMDVWKLATDEDKLKALASFVAMPAPKSVSPEQAEIADATFDVSLRGVTRYGLERAVEAILQGALNHEFAPNPVELRKQCDKAMEWHARERDRIIRQEKIRREREPDIPPRTADEIARHKERMARFYEASGYEDGRKIAQERVTLDPALVAQIADAPTTWKRTA